MFTCRNKKNESGLDKTYKMGCVPSEDSDQPGHSPSLISLCCLHEESLGPYLPIECTVMTDQTGWMHRLIKVFTVRTCHFVILSYVGSDMYLNTPPI